MDLTASAIAVAVAMMNFSAQQPVRLAPARLVADATSETETLVTALIVIAVVASAAMRPPDAESTALPHISSDSCHPYRPLNMSIITMALALQSLQSLALPPLALPHLPTQEFLIH